jgi:hypothetical protein
MKALISKIEPRVDGYRVAQVVADEETFDVTNDFMWVDCPNTVTADGVWYDLGNSEFKEFPVIVPPILTAQQKLDDLGLTVDDLKSLLGIK